MDELYNSLIEENQIIKLNDRFYTKKGIKNQLVLKQLVIEYAKRIPEIDQNIIAQAEKLMKQFGEYDTSMGLYEMFDTEGINIRYTINVLGDGYILEDKPNYFTKEEYDKAVINSEMYISNIYSEINQTHKTL